MEGATIKNQNLYWRLWQEIRAFWPHLAALFLLALLSPPLALLTPLPLKIAFDNVIDGRPLPRFLGALLPGAVSGSRTGLLALVVILIVMVTVLAQLRDLLSGLLSAYTGEKLLRRFRARLFRHVQRLSLSYHDAKGTADSTYRIQYDATGINNLAVEGLVPFFTSALTFCSMLYVTLRINWRLALVTLAVSPIMVVVSRVYRQRLRRQSREVRKIESSAMSLVQVALSAVRVVKAFGQEEHEERRFVQQSNQGMRARIRLAFMEGSFGLLMALMTGAGTATVVWIGLDAIQSQTLTRGDLLLVMGYMAQLYTPLKTISKKMASMQSHLAGVERAFALLDEAPDVVEHPRARALKRACGSIVFRNVCFTYKENQPVLRDISFEVTPGACVGLAGRTGAGKTTLVSLMTRFYDPTSGAIMLDGVDLREYKLADLRNQFAMVLQEPVLFPTSIAENIAYARPGASETEIIAAAKAANAHEFINRLPQGYRTLVGERGMCVSGGERQRISIARAFLKNAPVLVLDEPTSSVDTKTEAAIVEAMERLMKGRTTFIIAHRLSTLRYCDLTLNLHQGQLLDSESAVQMSVGEALAAASGRFAPPTELSA